MTGKHDEWLVEQLRSIPALAGSVFEGQAVAVNAAGTQTPLVDPPYAVVYAADGTDSQPRFSSGDVRQHPRWIIHFVGETVEQAKEAARLFKAHVFPFGLGVIPEIPAERCGPVWWDSPTEIQRDDDLQPPLFYQITECGFFADLTPETEE